MVGQAYLFVQPKLKLVTSKWFCLVEEEAGAAEAMAAAPRVKR